MVQTPGAPLGSTSSSVCGAVVAHALSERVRLCSDNCAFVVYYTCGVCNMLVVTCGDQRAVLANLCNLCLIGYIAPTPPPPPWYIQHK